MKNPDTLRMIAGQAESALEQIARDADYRRPADAEQVKNLLCIIHKTEELEGGAGYSQRNYPMMGYSGTDYENGSSYARNRLGQYTTPRYSRMTMEEHLAQMEQDATPEERQKIAAMRQILA